MIPTRFLSFGPNLDRLRQQPWSRIYEMGFMSFFIFRRKTSVVKVPTNSGLMSRSARRRGRGIWNSILDTSNSATYHLNPENDTGNIDQFFHVNCLFFFRIYVRLGAFPSELRCGGQIKKEVASLLDILFSWSEKFVFLIYLLGLVFLKNKFIFK